MLSFIACGLLVFWWRSGRTWAWYACLIAACLAVNTKSSGLVLFPIAFVCLAFGSDMSWRLRLRRAALSAVLVAAGVGSIPVARAATDPTARHLVTMNVEGLPPALVLPSQPRNFITFDPVQIVSRPENFPWDDSQRRQFLMEFFFRSAFFGEFTFAPQLRTVERVILLAALLGLPLIVFGVARELTDAHTEWPMIVAAGALLAAFVAYRTQFPFAPSQDFRYVTFLAVPLTFFAVRGAFSLPRVVRPFAIGALATLAGSCAAFVLLVIF
jgi:4-amino-4-deoxy-L-arabinose transferase-like glycosyltransferase